MSRLGRKVDAIIRKEKTAQRWEKGTPHHPKSEALMRFLAEVDYVAYDDSFGWKLGGDGDNGESLMYELDAFFDNEDLILSEAKGVSTPTQEERG